MSPPFVILDGYNVLHAAGLARMQYGPGDLERARQRLLALLANKLRADERTRCTVVFDAQQAPPDAATAANHHGLAVRFAPAGQDADTVIEQLIASHPASRRLIVVSSDHRLHHAAKRRSAKPVDSETFLAELDRRESISPLKETTEESPAKAPPRRGTKRDDEWLKEFGEIDVSELAHEVDREQLHDTTRSNTEADRLAELQRQLDDPDFLERWLK